MNAAQKREAEAVIYGLHEGQQPMSILDRLSPEERAQLIAEVKDAVNSPAEPTKEFDLAKPPTPQYRHQEYPRLVYHHGERKHKAVKSDEELAAAKEDGYQVEPFPAEAPVVELDDASAAEADAVDKKIAKLKKQKKTAEPKAE